MSMERVGEGRKAVPPVVCCTELEGSRTFVCLRMFLECFRAAVLAVVPAASLCLSCLCTRVTSLVHLMPLVYLFRFSFFAVVVAASYLPQKYKNLEDSDSQPSENGWKPEL